MPKCLSIYFALDYNMYFLTLLIESELLIKKEQQYIVIIMKIRIYYAIYQILMFFIILNTVNSLLEILELNHSTYGRSIFF